MEENFDTQQCPACRYKVVTKQIYKNFRLAEEFVIAGDERFIEIRGLMKDAGTMGWNPVEAYACPKCFSIHIRP